MVSMATIVNNPGNDSGAVTGLAVAVVVIVALGLIAFFVWPGFNANTGGGTNINVEVPALDAGGGGAAQ